MFQTIAALVSRRGVWVVLAWVALTAGLRWVAPSWDSISRDDNVRFFPASSPSVVGQDLLERGFPSDASSSQVVFVAERPEADLNAADYEYIESLVKKLGEMRASDSKLMIRRIDWWKSLVIGPRLVGRARDGKGQCALTIVSLDGTYLAKSTRLTVDRLEKMRDELPPPPLGLRLGMTGSAVVGHDMNNASNRSVANTTTATIALVVVILLVVYRSPLLALIPLVTIALSAWVSLMGVAELTTFPRLGFQVIDITNVFVIVVLFGAGTDYCLFLIARYREELVRGLPRAEALTEAIKQVGGALVASAGTVIIGLGMLWFSQFQKTQYTGPAIALSLAVGLVASLTLAPVLLSWLRNAVFWPFKPPHHEGGADVERETVELMPMARFWFRAADLVVRYPGRILLLSVIPLLPFAIVGAMTRSNYSQLADLDPDQTSVVGARMIRDYFAVGELSPATILVEHPGLNFRDKAGRDAVAKVSAALEGVEKVAEVRSVTQPLGKPDNAKASSGFLMNLGRQAIALGVESMYVATNPVNPADRDHITRFTLVFDADPFADASLRSLDDARRTVQRMMEPGGPLAGAKTTGLTGATAMVYDLRQVTTGDERRMYILVTLGVFAILVALLRRPLICVYLIATVVLGYLASLGVTELVFRALHAGPEPWVGLDWKVGFFLFVILVAVGEDYNIFLMSRVIEEEKKHGTIEGTRLAVAHTGGIISSCGLIMAGTFGSMLTGSLTALRELGFALGLGVLLDTFLVRPVLVPAFIVLLHRIKEKRFGSTSRSVGSEPDSSGETSPEIVLVSIPRRTPAGR